MRPKSLALLLVALGCGLVASVGITQVMAKRNVASGGVSSRPIFVAMTDIGMGDQLTAQVLKLEQWPKDKIPAGAVSQIEDVEGCRTRTRLYVGEPILESKLLGKGGSSCGATALIPKGYRVVPVKVDLVSGGSSLILPGDRVDVMVHLVRNVNRDIPETITRTILQDIKVFAVNDVVGLENEKDINSKSIIAKTISLLVTPDQAATLMLATQMGTVNLVMRSPEDDQQAPNAQARPSELLGTTDKSQRSKESLLEPAAANLSDRAKGFLDFLTSMKAKSAVASAGEQPRATWTMRVIKSGMVDEVLFEAEETKTAQASPFGLWKTSAAVAKPAAVQPVVEELQVVPPPPAPKKPPAAAEPQPPKREPAENAKADKA